MTAQEEPRIHPLPLAPQVNWIKKDGNCATCNLPADHDTANCPRPAVCWTCGSVDHQRFDCPEDPSPPPRRDRGRGRGGGRGRGRGRAKTVNNVQKTAEPSPPVEDVETVEGFYSVAPSQASTMSGTPCNIVVDFIAPPGGKFRSLYGLAGIWDSGQLTSNHIVMRESVFREYIGTTMQPYIGQTIHAANSQPLDIVGVVEIGLAMPGLDNLRPTIVQMMICKSLSSDFLMGRRMLDDWDLSIKYKGKTETWIVGNQQVRAQTARQAREYNRGLIGLDYVYETQQGWRASMKINSGRGPWKRYRWADITQSFLPPPP